MKFISKIVEKINRLIPHKHIYVVTAMDIVDFEYERDGVKHNTLQTESKRTWAWYSTLKEAKYDVSINHCDMFEYRYNYVVIERIYEGMLGVLWSKNINEDTLWYYWNGGEFESCECPEYYEHVHGFGIG